MVRAMRRTTAAPEPHSTASLCWCAGKVRAANAITTALSPDRMMLIQTIFTSPIQKSGDCSISMRREFSGAARAAARTASEQRLEQLAHLGRVACHLEPALFHDRQLRIG